MALSSMMATEKGKGTVVSFDLIRHESTTLKDAEGVQRDNQTLIYKINRQATSECQQV